jgi:uncharacterized OsmC-like protein
MPTLPPRRWVTRASWNPPGPIAVFAQDKSLEGPVSPVEYLLIAVASCFVLSLEIARKSHAWAECYFDVACTGTKAPDAPSRLAQIALEVSVAGPLNDEQIAALVTEAKGLCTVTNTLAGAHTVEVKW